MPGRTGRAALGWTSDQGACGSYPRHCNDRVDGWRMAERLSLVDPVRRSLATCDPPATDVVVAVSGGPDSVALLRAVLQTKPVRVVVAHVNHGWRGASSDSDEAFVHDLTARLRENGSPVEFRALR